MAFLASLTAKRSPPPRSSAPPSADRRRAPSTERKIKEVAERDLGRKKTPEPDTMVKGWGRQIAREAKETLVEDPDPFILGLKHIVHQILTAKSSPDLIAIQNTLQELIATRDEEKAVSLRATIKAHFAVLVKSNFFDSSFNKHFMEEQEIVLNTLVNCIEDLDRPSNPEKALQIINQLVQGSSGLVEVALENIFDKLIKKGHDPALTHMATQLIDKLMDPVKESILGRSPLLHKLHLILIQMHSSKSSIIDAKQGEEEKKGAALAQLKQDHAQLSESQRDFDILHRSLTEEFWDQVAASSRSRLPEGSQLPNTEELKALLDNIRRSAASPGDIKQALLLTQKIYTQQSGLLPQAVDFVRQTLADFSPLVSMAQECCQALKATSDNIVKILETEPLPDGVGPKPTAIELWTQAHPLLTDITAITKEMLAFMQDGKAKQAKGAPAESELIKIFGVIKEIVTSAGPALTTFKEIMEEVKGEPTPQAAERKREESEDSPRAPESSDPFMERVTAAKEALIQLNTVLASVNTLFPLAVQLIKDPTEVTPLMKHVVSLFTAATTYQTACNASLHAPQNAENSVMKLVPPLLKAVQEFLPVLQDMEPALKSITMAADVILTRLTAYQIASNGQTFQVRAEDHPIRLATGLVNTLHETDILKHITTITENLAMATDRIARATEAVFGRNSPREEPAFASRPLSKPLESKYDEKDERKGAARARSSSPGRLPSDQSYLLESMINRLASLEKDLRPLQRQQKPRIISHLNVGIRNAITELHALLDANFLGDEHRASVGLLIDTLSHTLAGPTSRTLSALLDSVRRAHGELKELKKNGEGVTTNAAFSYFREAFVSLMDDVSESVSDGGYAAIAKTLFHFVNYLFETSDVPRESEEGKKLDTLLKVIEKAEKNPNREEVIKAFSEASKSLEQLGIRIHGIDIFSTKIEKNTDIRLEIDSNLRSAQQSLGQRPVEAEAIEGATLQTEKDKAIFNYSSLAILKAVGEIFDISQWTEQVYRDMIQTANGNKTALKVAFYRKIEADLADSPFKRAATKVSFFVLSFFIHRFISNYLNTIVESTGRFTKEQSLDHYSSLQTKILETGKDYVSNLNSILLSFGNGTSKTGKPIVGSKDTYTKGWLEMPAFNKRFTIEKLYESWQDAIVTHFYSGLGWSKQMQGLVESGRSSSSSPIKVISNVTLPISLPIIGVFAILETLFIDWPFKAIQKVFLKRMRFAQETILKSISEGIKDQHGYSYPLHSMLYERLQTVWKDLTTKPEEGEVHLRSESDYLSASNKEHYKELLHNFIEVLSKDQKSTSEQINNQSRNPTIFQRFEQHFDDLIVKGAMDDLIKRLAISFEKTKPDQSSQDLLLSAFKAINAPFASSGVVSKSDKDQLEGKFTDLLKAILEHQIRETIDDRFRSGVDKNRAALKFAIDKFKGSSAHFLQDMQSLIQQARKAEGPEYRLILSQLKGNIEQFNKQLREDESRSKALLGIDGTSGGNIQTVYNTLLKDHLVHITRTMKGLAEGDGDLESLNDQITTLNNYAQEVQPDPIYNVEFNLFTNWVLNHAKEAAVEVVKTKAEGLVSMLSKGHHIEAALRQVMLLMVERLDPNTYRQVQADYHKRS